MMSKIQQMRHSNVLMLNLSKPTGYVMHQQFNIQQLYVMPTLYLCVLYLCENKQRRSEDRIPVEARFFAPVQTGRNIIKTVQYM
jgi:hypothetical protein